ncbi:hypothetical protein [Pseudomonas putida]|uniref:Uncharacterized protein n=1 Tax=Pseudomonas putida TaxID=303 RepID=A0A8I1ED57_PSEPU|nr:hypothetical protein [Pseudomonas putida]MBI6883084.1 hypothetical protein [Pseudomonas putida]
MEKTIKNLKAGDTLFVLKRHYNKPGPYLMEIVTVGHKWISLQGQVKLCRHTLKADGFTGYLSEEHYEEHCRIVRMRERCAKNMTQATTEQIEEIAKILGVNGDKPQ